MQVLSAPEVQLQLWKSAYTAAPLLSEDMIGDTARSVGSDSVVTRIGGAELSSPTPLSCCIAVGDFQNDAVQPDIRPFKVAIQSRTMPYSRETTHMAAIYSIVLARFHTMSRSMCAPRIASLHARTCACFATHF